MDRSLSSNESNMQVSVVLALTLFGLLFQTFMMFFEYYAVRLPTHGIRSLVLVVGFLGAPLFVLYGMRVSWRSFFKEVGAWLFAFFAAFGFYLVFDLKPSGDDLFRASFVSSIYAEGYPVLKSFWLYGAEGTVGYYVFFEYLAACLKYVFPFLEMPSLYTVYLKAALLATTLCLAYQFVKSIVREGEDARHPLFSEGKQATLLLFLAVAVGIGFSPFRFAIFHQFLVLQSMLSSFFVFLLVNLILVVSLCLRDKSSNFRTKIRFHFVMISLALMPAYLALSKFIILPPFIVALATFWIISLVINPRKTHLLFYIFVSVSTFALAMHTLKISEAGSGHRIFVDPLTVLKNFVHHPDDNFVSSYLSYPFVQSVLSLYGFQIVLLVLGRVNFKRLAVEAWLSFKSRQINIGLVCLLLLFTSGHVAFLLFRIENSGFDESYWMRSSWIAGNLLAVWICIKFGKLNVPVFSYLLLGLSINVLAAVELGRSNINVGSEDLQLCEKLQLVSEQDGEQAKLVIFSDTHWGFSSCNSIPNFMPSAHTYSRLFTNGSNVVGTRELNEEMVFSPALTVEQMSRLRGKLHGFKGSIYLIRNKIPQDILPSQFEVIGEVASKAIYRVSIAM